jgi:anti-sigma factor RsiW
MTDRNPPVTHDELHAFVDGELPAGRRGAVEAWLANHPDDAALVAAWRAQAEAIRTHYGAIAEEPVPARLKIDQLMRNGRHWRSIVAAAAIAAFIFGGVAGWMARGASAASAPSPAQQFTREALGAHRLYIGEVRHAVEVGATEAHLMPWLSKRVGTTLRAPDLNKQGLKLLGGRLLPGIQGPAAQFMYESANGERITLYCSRLATARSAFHYTVADNIAAVQWSDDGFGWAVSGAADKQRLTEIAQAIYEQMENRASPASRSSLDWIIGRRS